MIVDVPVEDLRAAAYSIPTETPESDGTAEWNQTTIIVVEIDGGGNVGLGYTYGDAAVATLVNGVLAGVVDGQDAFSIGARWDDMARACRNVGRPGIASMAISAVDLALWDLKAKLLGLSLTTLLGRARDAVPIYGSGGFTSLSHSELAAQLSGFVEDGIPRVKMKVGRDPQDDVIRVRHARRAIGADCELYVDANGAFTRKQALWFAERIVEDEVSWFEEPVSSDDLDGLRLVRDRAPAGMEITAGEYAFAPWDFERLLAAGAVDCLQADCTRCQGTTGFLKAAALAEARSLDVSAHCGPAIHVHPGCAAPRVRHLEYFADHVRVETLLFEGVCQPENGRLRPDRSRPGNGLSFNRDAAEQFAI